LLILEVGSIILIFHVFPALHIAIIVLKALLLDGLVFFLFLKSSALFFMGCKIT